jgi:ATP adenylyltransferase
MSYIRGEEEEKGCLFCNRAAQEDGPENLILHRGQRIFVILNRYPYTNGHVMVVPFDHQPSIENLDHETQAELMHITAQVLNVLRRQYAAESFNIGVNIGDAAGAGVADHVHVHIVPRWTGDTNFMTTTASTRVLPEALEETYENLRQHWQKPESS